MSEEAQSRDQRGVNDGDVGSTQDSKVDENLSREQAKLGNGELMNGDVGERQSKESEDSREKQSTLKSSTKETRKPVVTLELKCLVVLIVIVVCSVFFCSGAADAPRPQKVTCRGLARNLRSNVLAKELVSLLRSDMDTIRGVLVQRNYNVLRDEIAPLEECCGGEGIFSERPFDTVDALRTFFSLERSRRGNSGKAKCAIYVVRVEHVKSVSVANGLKELLDMNKLHGADVIPHDYRALILFVSEKPRERVKDELPHRVVHLLRSL